ncbi:MAG: pyruvate carboxylase subunit B [Clostridia bacterium]
MKINLTETILRDANQSLMATRLPFEDFEPILEKMDKAGYYSVECWGGATFDSCLRYLSEDPWERLRKIKKAMPNTKLQMLLRGQNILGYKHYSDDTVTRFVTKAVENGIDIIRIFDALNDFRNIETAVNACIKAGGHAQGTICYTKSPIHNLELYIKLGQEIEKMGCHSLCVKDMAGIMSPFEVYELVSALKKSVTIPISVHTHDTTGLGAMTLLKAVEAGADIIDCATSAFAGGTSQPPTETLVYTLKQLGHEFDVKEEILKEVNDFFIPIKAKYIADGTLDPYVLGPKSDCLTYQIPGGMLSNLVAQLKAQNSLDKLDEVLLETPKVREDMGYPPLVTPLSQMVGSQAVVNVLLGERYKSIGKEIQAYIKGEYGTAPGTISEDLIKKVLGDDKPMTGRMADTLEPEFEKAKEELGDKATSEEDVLSYIAFPAQALAYFEEKELKSALKVTYSIKEVK